MTMKIQETDGWQCDMKEVTDFAKALDRIKPQCDLLDPISVHDTLLKIDQQVDREAQAYPNNEMVKVLARGAKLTMWTGLEEEVRKAQNRA